VLLIQQGLFFVQKLVKHMTYIRVNKQEVLWVETLLQILQIRNFLVTIFYNLSHHIKVGV